MRASFSRKIRERVDCFGASVASRFRAAIRSAVALPAQFEPLEQRTLLSTYYVSNSGNDSNSGSSPSSAWATVGRANSQSLHPGDSLLFQGGNTFNGQLTIGSNDSGSSAAPVTVGSYGSGRAKLTVNAGRGIYVLNSQFVNIQNFVIVGLDSQSSSSYGIKIENNLNNATRTNIHVDNVDVSGFNQYGIYVFVDSAGSWLNNISITNSSVHNNTLMGIDTNGAGQYSLQNLYIGHCDVYGNAGNDNSATAADGGGILICSVDGGTVEYCTCHDNGANGSGSGGLGSAASTNVVLQYNEVYSNHTAGPRDGDGMGFDINTVNSIIQYNYVHDNDGSGIQLDNWLDNDAESNNTIRYNLIVNNGLKHNYAGLQIWGKVINSAIYDNVVYVNEGASMGIKIHNASVPTLCVDNVQFLNNIIITTGGRSAVTVSPTALAGAAGLVFAGNDYFAATGALSISYGNSGFSSVSSWQAATKQETSNGKSVGLGVNPLLVNPGSDPTFDDATKIATLSAYRLQSSSSLIGRGVSVPSLGLPAATTDFFHQAVHSTLDIGADQQYGTGSASPEGNPAPWSNVDIGTVGKAGNTSASGSTYTVTGSGADIYGTADAFQYDYQTLNGDGQIIAEVNSISAATAWSKAGVMIRDGNGAGAKEVSMLVSANGKAEFERRWSTNGSTGTTDVAATTPEWIKLVRTGNTFISYLSKDGKTWTQVGSTVVTMNSTVEIGLAVTSHVAGALATATFSNVSVVT